MKKNIHLVKDGYSATFSDFTVHSNDKKSEINKELTNELIESQLKTIDEIAKH
jgi:outer membrane lipopolysaccharide assembly protein LptE/RlpB